MRRNSLYPLVALAVSFLPVSAAGNGWLTDFEAAKKTAAKEKKDLLLDFTGSDWCHWCKKLKTEVFEKGAFKTGVAGKFVLVELDFPQNQAKLDAKTRKQNQRLAEIYGVQGYPTIILADAKGRPFARSGYEPGGAETYVKHLDLLREGRVVRDKAFATAAELKGVEKAKALQNALGELGDDAVDLFYPEVPKQIAEADPTDETGFSKGRTYRKAVVEYEKKIEVFFGAKQYKAALGEADGFLARHKPAGEDKQHILMAKVMALVEMRKKEEAFKLLDAIKEAAPESGLSGQLDTMRARIEVYLKEQPGQPAPAPGSEKPVPE